VGTQLHVDIDNGDIIRLLPVEDGEEGHYTKYCYPGGYVTMGLINITRLVDANLPADGYRLALIIAARAVPVTGLCLCSNEEYGKELGVSANRVSRMIGKLVQAKLIHRAGPRLVMVNPGWCFRGRPAEQHAALQTWMKLHPIGIVRKQERKSA
jgi:hypothetical protein